MTFRELKEANRLFWIVKGHLIPDSWDEQSIRSMERSYFERLWGNNESCYHEVGFEEEWLKKMSKM